jgi:Lrp/AsnC family leucine-responsive transcriptional regulator
MSLTSQDKELLFELQSLGTQPLSHLAKRKGMRESTLQSKISRWEEEGAIARRVFVNTFATGAIGLEIFFTPSRDVKGARDHLTKAVLKSSGVRWFYRTAGKHEFILGIEARGFNNLTAHLERLDAKVRGIFATRDIAVSRGYWWFGRKYLAAAGTKHDQVLEQLPASQVVAIDEIDHQILKIVGQQGARSARSIADSLKIPQSTVGYRLAALEKKRVIVGYPYLISPAWLGMSIYRLQLGFSTCSPLTHNELLAWCKQHPSVLSVMRLLGPWDYSLRCEVACPEEMTQLTDSLHEQFGHVLRECSVVSVVKEISFSYYPIETFGE